jgi:GrpB-like predicted nucleotidyltransferase (UPF0157 family)
VLVTYDSSWPDQYQAAAAAIRAIEAGWQVEHIGSTSIIGMPAKPIIDLAVRVQCFDDLDERLPELEAIGWRRIRRGPQSHRVLVQQDADRRTHIAHFFTADQWDTCNQRIFRDWLRASPEDRHRYLEAKRAAAEAGPGREYTARKTEVVQAITDRARAARGLPPVDVWEK